MGEQNVIPDGFKISIPRTGRDGRLADPFVTTVSGLTVSKLTAVRSMMRRAEMNGGPAILNAIDVILGDFIGPMLPAEHLSSIEAMMCSGEIDVVDLINSVMSFSDTPGESTTQPNRATRRRRGNRGGGNRGGVRDGG